MGGSHEGSVLPPAPPPQFIKPFSHSQCFLKDSFPGEQWGSPHWPKSLELPCSRSGDPVSVLQEREMLVPVHRVTVCVSCVSHQPVGKSGLFSGVKQKVL